VRGIRGCIYLGNMDSPITWLMCDFSARRYVRQQLFPDRLHFGQAAVHSLLTVNSMLSPALKFKHENFWMCASLMCSWVSWCMREEALRMGGGCQERELDTIVTV
jgi:hypothetical protein